MSSMDWQRRIDHDLAPFADPTTTGSRLSWRGNRAYWESFGKKHTAVFGIDDKGITVTFSRRSWPYSKFLASEHVADLTGLAKRSLHWHANNPYVRTRAVASDGNDYLATELLTKLMHEQENDATQVIFVTGDAGAGKTCTLQHLAREQAQSYLDGTTHWLYLYVNAQGRALASLDEAFAVELDNLRTPLTYGMITPLVRNGLLIPIIDGFDELLGSTYEDGFASLSRFLEDLDGAGRVVACARSTYYEQEFEARATTSSQLGSQTWQVLLIRLLGWGDGEREEFVRQTCEDMRFSSGKCNRSRNKLKKVLERAPSHLVQRPFFFSRLTVLVFEGLQVEDTLDLVTAVVDAYIERECTLKLLTKVTREPFLQPYQLKEILTNIAEEMWREETRELAVDEVKIQVSLTVTIDELNAQVKERIEQRSPMLAFLTPATGSTSGRVAFEHELFFSYFLGIAFARALEATVTYLLELLRRARLPTHAADVALRHYKANTFDIVKLCGGHSHYTYRAETIRGNSGALIGASLRALDDPRTVDALTFSSVAFRNQALPHVTFRTCVFADVEFSGVDLTTTRFEECTARDLSLIGCEIDPRRTMLQIAGIGLEAVIGPIKHPQQTLYDPNIIRTVLRSCGLPAATQRGPTYNVHNDIVTLVTRLMAMYEHASVIWPEDPKLAWLRNSEGWAHFRRSLIDSGVVVETTTSVRGALRPRWRRRFSSIAIMAGYYRNATVPEEVRALWQALEDART